MELPETDRTRSMRPMVSNSLIKALNSALLRRDVKKGFSILNQAERNLDQFAAGEADATAIVLCIAQWVDVGYRDVSYLSGLESRLGRLDRSSLPLRSYINLRLIEAFQAFASENHQTTEEILDSVLKLESSVLDGPLRAIAHFWKGRSHRSQGDYELAMKHILEAKHIACLLKAPKFEAEIKTHESWLYFQRGEKAKAVQLLNEAELALRNTGHDLALGNIESARGRIARRAGEYAKALAHFERAVTIYSKQFSNHPSCARALVNLAYLNRLIALDLKHRANRSGRARAAQHDQYLNICQGALQLLARAGEIYHLRRHQTGQGAVYVNAGYLHLDSGDIDLAENEASKAFSLGEKGQDLILMARARTLQSAIQNERVEEQLGEALDITLHATLAKDYAAEAVAIAKRTDNKRLLAGAYIAVSATAASDFYQDWEKAREFAALAGSLLDKSDHDHLSREFSQVQSRILKATEVDEMLRQWSEGIIANKTFQQVTEEFAEIVIPKVWLREGKNTSNVAQRLSMSPKKIRRILRNAHMDRSDKP
jgi:tetratricopeptide (TPR) repeat protein